MSSSADLVLEAMDRAVVLVRRLPGWAGVLWLGTMPSRFLLVLFIDQVCRIGPSLGSHGHALLGFAEVVLAAWMIGVVARQFFTRAIRLLHEGGNTDLARVLALPWRSLLTAIYVCLVYEMAFWATLPCLVLAAILPLLGLACAAAVEQDAGGLQAPWRLLLSVPVWPLLLFGIALLMIAAVVGLNLIGGLYLLQHLVHGVTGVSFPGWEALLNFNNRLFVLLICMATVTILEPFAVACMSIMCTLAKAQRSGDDLKQWFALLRSRQVASSASKDLP